MNSNLTIDGIDDVAAHFGDFRGQLRVLLPVLQIQDVAAALNFFFIFRNRTHSLIFYALSSKIFFIYKILTTSGFAMQTMREFDEFE